MTTISQTATNTEVSRIREELRALLMSEQVESAQPLLLRLRTLAAFATQAGAADGGDELLGEYARWAVRFRLLASMQRPDC